MNSSITNLLNRGISLFIFRGGWRGGRLDICKDGLQVRTLFRLLNSLLHRFGDVIIYVIQTGRFPMIEKKLSSCGGGDTTSTALRSSFSTHSKNCLTRKLSSSSLHHSLDSFFDRLIARASYVRGGRVVVWVRGVARFHGKHARDRKRRYSIFHYLFRPIVYLASFYNGQFTIALHWVGIRAIRLYMHSAQSGICMTAC